MKFIKIVTIILLLCVIEVSAKKVTINFQNTPILDVVKFVAKKYNKNILINQNISGNVNFISNKPIDEDELFALLEQVLRVKGYALTKSGANYYEIVRANDASKDVQLDKTNTVGMQIEILRPKFIKPSVAASKIKHLASSYAVITSDDKMNLLLITDYPKKIANIKKLLNLFDTNLKRELKVVTLENYRVKLALPKLKAMFKLVAGQYKGAIELFGAEYQNAVWVSANSEDIAKVIKTIKYFDSKAKNNIKTNTKIIFLKNANADDIIKTIQTIAKSLDANNPIKTVVTSNKELNAIIINSSNSSINELMTLIQQIDIERRQVFVKVQIYEISQNTIDNMGIKWGIAGGYANKVGIATSSVNMGGSYFALPDILASNISLDAVNKGIAVGAVIDLIKGDGGVNTLSEPNLLCLNNVKSSIYVGKTQSILTSSAKGDNTADITRNNYSREDIGLKLEITPQIADKNKVVLKVKSKIEDVDSSSNADRPTTTKREIDTTTIVQNGESVIIGGMLRDNKDQSSTKVPLLGDIPLIGGLFRSKSTINDKISLVIIMTPYIVNSSLELQDIQKKLERLNMQKVRLTEKMRTELDKIVKENEKKNRLTDNLHSQQIKALMGEED
ncbi:MAG: hypothetical protein DRG78_01065 [Epsilonproteobacteria bacterium]|nr:MAG: hypothetical protein DRG78_01065 [Campylobacterota bacterium]